MDLNKIKIIKLWLVQGIGPVLFRKLLAQFGSIDEIFNADLFTLMRIDRMQQKTADFIINKKEELERLLEQELRLIEKQKVKAFVLGDEEYPQLLREIFDPPPVLYVKGTLIKEDVNAIAIVGSRAASNYALMTTKKLARDLACNGITIVSGLARGIDTEAHKGALESGRTIAVLGGGISVLYPPENAMLAEKISDKGAVISEFPLSMMPDKKTFPMRNRVISGLSLGTVVIEGSKRSGALITAKSALEQGRDVFAVPGLITNPRTYAPHSLLRDGAGIVTCANDILDELGLNIKNRKYFCDIPLNKDKHMTDEEQRIYVLLEKDLEMQINDIRDKAGRNILDVMRILGSLELKGLIKQCPGKFYCKIL
ncbi:MAG: DNA-processing protein DprA [Elusimicrobiota bacterium]